MPCAPGIRLGLCSPPCALLAFEDTLNGVLSTIPQGFQFNEISDAWTRIKDTCLKIIGGQALTWDIAVGKPLHLRAPPSVPSTWL